MNEEENYQAQQELIEASYIAINLYYFSLGHADSTCTIHQCQLNLIYTPNFYG